MSKLQDRAQFPKGPLDNDEDFNSIFRFFGKVFGFAVIVWVLGSLASLALVVAIIYFLVSAAGAF